MQDGRNVSRAWHVNGQQMRAAAETIFLERATLRVLLWLASLASIDRHRRVSQRLRLCGQRKFIEFIPAKTGTGEVGKGEEQKENGDAAINAVGSQQIGKSRNFHTLTVLQATTNEKSRSISKLRRRKTDIAAKLRRIDAPPDVVVSLRRQFLLQLKVVGFRAADLVFVADDLKPEAF